MARIDFDGKQIDIPDFALEKTMQEVLRSLREEGVLVKQSIKTEKDANKKIQKLTEAVTKGNKSEATQNKEQIKDR